MKDDQHRAVGMRTALFAGALVAGSLGAQALAQPRPDGMRPPQEAFDACNGRQAGDACAVSFHGNTIQGSCRAADDNRLFCLPSGPPPRP